MSSDVKAELSSELLDYIWYSILNKKENHTDMNNDSNFYISDADAIWIKLYDIVSDVCDKETV